MIPEHYWRILRNWYWLIGGVALACALIAAAALPALLNGDGSGHSSSVTLGVTRLVSFSGTTVAGEGDGEAMASESVKERIRKIIESEDALRPMSDQRIAEMLKAANIDIARRTVTKYREAMNILSSTRRRQVC